MADHGPSSAIVWAPWLLAAITLFGLIAALVGGPAFAPAAWVALLAPILVAAQRIMRRIKGPRR